MSSRKYPAQLWSFLTKQYLTHLRESQGATSNSELCSFFHNKSNKDRHILKTQGLDQALLKSRTKLFKLRSRLPLDQQSSSENTITLNQSSDEVLLRYSDPMKKDLYVESLTHLGMHHKRDDKRQRMMMAKLRHNISKKHKSLKFRYLERLFYIFVVGIIVVGSILKSIQDSSSGNVFDTMLFLYEVGYSLRSASIYYKQAIRRDIVNDIQLNESYYYGGTFINWLSLNMTRKVITNNFKNVPAGYTGQKRPWTNGTGPTNPNSTYSLLTYSYLVQTSLIETTGKAISLKDFRGNKTAYLWNDLQFYSRIFYNIMIDDFEVAISTTGDMLVKVRWYIYTACFLAVIIVLGTGIILVLINLTLGSQIEDCEELLLKLNKKTIQHSLSTLKIKIATEEENRNQANSEVSGTEALATKYKIRASDSNLPGMQQPYQQDTLIMTQEEVVPNSKKGKYAKIKNNMAGQKNLRISFMKRESSAKLKLRNIVLLAIFLTLIITNCITELVVFFTTYYSIKAKLEAFDIVIAMTNTIYIYGGLLYKQYHILESPTAKPLTTLDRPVSQKLLNYQKQMLNLPDPYLRQLITDLDLCTSLPSTVSLSNVQICKENTGFNGSFSLFSAYSRIFTYHQELASIISLPRRPSLKSYLEQRTVAETELLITFFTSAVRRLTDSYTTNIRNDISQRVNATNTILWILFCILALCTLYYWKIWSKHKLEDWKRLMHTYLVMSDTILDNEYLKVYFSIHSSYRL